MNEEKMKIIKNTSDEYKLPKDKQMYVLGFMQGILCNRSEDKQLQEA